MNYVYMSTCMKALCRHVKQNKQQGEGDRYHTAHPHHTTEGGRDSTTPGSTTVLWLTHDNGRGVGTLGPYIGVWGVFSLIRRNQPADWIFIVARRSLDWFLDAMADVQDHCNVKHSCRKDGEGGKCLEKDDFFRSPEYSPWFTQDSRSRFTFMRVRGAKRWTYDTVNLQPVIVRSKGMADCFRLIGGRKECLSFTAKGWDKARWP
ncbi:unnamed protein product [Cladocopium goreaui]|uniref:Uncharacterized protein n=1 Tax=Cladocopium goreaui TaxID=2562237 RepID=A0A9P1BT14_9DINO|nr:unnamed protein product [Cladocopium goreaui]